MPRLRISCADLLALGPVRETDNALRRVLSLQPANRTDGDDASVCRRLRCKASNPGNRVLETASSTAQVSSLK
jgi:hypothetical protein